MRHLDAEGAATRTCSTRQNVLKANSILAARGFPTKRPTCELLNCAEGAHTVDTGSQSGAVATSEVGVHGSHSRVGADAIIGFCVVVPSVPTDERLGSGNLMAGVAGFVLGGTVADASVAAARSGSGRSGTVRERVSAPGLCRGGCCHRKELHAGASEALRGDSGEVLWGASCGAAAINLASLSEPKSVQALASTTVIDPVVYQFCQL